MRTAIALAFFLSLTASPAGGQQQTRVLAPGASSPAAAVTDLAWLAGEWTGEGFGAVVHESYSAPVGGQMPGHFYIARNGQPELHEFVMIAAVGKSLEYRVRHFNPDMTAWEEKERFVKFALVAVEPDSWYFDGLTIRRTGPDSTEHIVRIKGKDGKVAEVVLKYRRAKPMNGANSN